MPRRDSDCSCTACERRCLLLGELSALLDYQRGRPRKLAELLALEEEPLIEALAGRRADDLRRRLDAACVAPGGPLPTRPEGERLCRHDRRWPASLRAPGCPHLLTIAAGRRRFGELLGGPTVAIVAASAGSEYGRQMASSLGRGLAAAGVTLVATLDGALGRAAHEGALQAGGATLAPLGDGLGVPPHGATRSLRAAVLERGCVMSQLPWQCAGRLWGRIAADRTALALADVAVAVETDDQAAALLALDDARALRTSLAAMPGLVTNRRAAGPHELLARGAPLVAAAADVLDLLHDAGAAPPPGASSPGEPPPGASSYGHGGLPAGQREVLERIGAGEDSLERLAGPDGDENDDLAVLAALGELEASGLIARTRSGRYLRRDAPR